MSDWRGFLLRRLLRQLRISDDVLRQMSTFQRLGATLESAPLREGLPLAARTIMRAVRTRSAADVQPTWLWPYWLERQLDPTGPSFVARGHLPTMQNVTARNWTMVGNPWAEHEAIVDPAGLVTVGSDTWSLDWWVRGSAGWRVPSRHGVRQSLVGCAPVVETSLDLTDGAVVQRVYAVETVPEVVAVEITNRTPGPVRVVVAVRPYNPEGLAVVQQLALDGTTVVVDRRPSVYLPGTPSAWHLSTYGDGDSATASMQEHPSSPHPPEVEDRAGLAQGAFAYEVEPGQPLRVALAMRPQTPRSRFPTPWRRRMRHTVPPPQGLPSGQVVAEDWRSRLDRGLRVTVPDARLQQAVDANRAFLLLLHDPGSITAGPTTYHRFWFRDAAYQVAALDRWGFHKEARDVVRTYPDRQRTDGFFYSQWREWDANGAAIWTIAEHHRLTGDAGLLAELADAVDSGARWIADTCADDRGKAPEARGLLPAGVSAEHFGPFDYYYWDDLWAWRGLVDAAAIARTTGRPELAEVCDRACDRLRATLEACWRRDGQRLGRPVIPAGPTRGVDAGMIGPLAACYPLDLLEVEDPRVQATLELLRERFLIGEAFYQGISHTGLGTYLTLQIAAVELRSGDPRAWGRLEWVLDAATPTYTWPEAVHPQLPGGCMGDGHHGWMAAELLNVVRMALLAETGAGLALLPTLPGSWRGGRVTVEHAPTHHGEVSYELDWEGEEAVLRWETERPGVNLRSPALDPGWSTTDQAGEIRRRPAA